MKFKQGDRIKCVNDDAIGITIGNTYEVSDIRSDRVYFFDDDKDYRYRPAEYYELAPLTPEEQLKELQKQEKELRSKVDDIQSMIKELRSKIEDQNKPKVGDIYVKTTGGSFKDVEMIVSCFEGTYVLVILDGCSKGYFWSSPTKDINKIWGLQHKSEFKKV